MRCGGDWRRAYGDFYTGTKGETPDTAKKLPTDYRASSRPYQFPDYGVASRVDVRTSAPLNDLRAA